MITIYSRVSRNKWEVLETPIKNPSLELARLSRALPTTPMVLVYNPDPTRLDYDALTIIENEQESVHHDYYRADFHSWHNMAESTILKVMKRLYRDDQGLNLHDVNNATQLAEATAEFINHPEYLDDETHIIWTLAHEVTQS